MKIKNKSNYNFFDKIIVIFILLFHYLFSPVFK